MKYSTKLFICSIVFGIISVFTYIHPFKIFYYTLYFAELGITLNNLIILFGIFLCIEFAIIGLYIKGKEK